MMNSYLPNILIIEDAVANLELLSKKLADEGYIMLPESDGKISVGEKKHLLCFEIIHQSLDVSTWPTLFPESSRISFSISQTPYSAERR